jgi:uncharacterized membrane protein YgcG
MILPRSFKWLALFVLGMSSWLLGQTCDSPVSDPGGFLNNSSQVQKATGKLIDQGADAHVLTFASLSQYGGNLDQAESQEERACGNSWQSDGKRKSNLIIFAVAPNDHRAAIYFGGAWDGALGHGHWTHIASDFMSPRFRSKDWAGGIAAGEEQAAARIVAFKDETVHPAVSTTTVNNQATDMSGFWLFLKWMLFIGALAGGIGFVYFYLSSRSKKRSQTIAAQQAAQQSKAALASELNSAREKLAELEAAKDEKASPLAIEFDVVSAQFTRLDQSSRMDPSQDGLSADQYTTIGSSYQDLRNRLYNAVTRATRSLQSQSASATASANSRHASRHRSHPASTPAPGVNKTTYEDNSVTVVNTPVYSEPERSESHTRSEETSSKSSSDSDSDRGSSFSWGSDSSSSSSSSSDSGSSFSFDSGSSGSDSGGSFGF